MKHFTHVGNRFTALLVVLTAFLGMQLIGELSAPEYVPPSIVDGQGAEDTGRGFATIPPLIPPKQAYAQVAIRPPFNPSRRTAPSVAKEIVPSVSSPRASLQGYALVGTVISPVVRIALLKSPTQPRITRLSEGEEFEGWKVTKITSQAVTLTSVDRSDTIEFPNLLRSSGGS